MELQIESAGGTDLPPCCHLGLRVGDTLKQGRYEPERFFSFPQAESDQSARIDIYQHVGSCILGISAGTREVDVVSNDPARQGMRLRVTANSAQHAMGRVQGEMRTKTLKTQAMHYLSKNCIEEKLAAAVKALVQVQPDDPIEFICRQLRDDRTDNTKLSNGSVPFAEYYRRHLLSTASFDSLHARFGTRSSSATELLSDQERRRHHLQQEAYEILWKLGLDSELSALAQRLQNGDLAAFCRT